jgi:2-oxoglutarate dehydrogenase E2 component (dihydrolipoamide succinyltransferase)
MASSISLPEMGEGVIEGTLSRWLVKEGDRIEKYAPIAEVETDKVTTETTSDAAGVVLKLCVREGETVPVGTVLAYVGEPGESVGENGGGAEARRGAGEVWAGRESGSRGETEGSPTADRGPQTASDRQQTTDGGRQLAAAATSDQRPATPYTGRISPVVGRIAAEHGVDLGRVKGTGRDGRITKEDILAYVEATPVARPPTAETAAETTDDRRPMTAEPVAAPVATPMYAETVGAGLKPAPTAAVEGAYELLPLTSIRRTIAEHMVRSKHTSPHVTTVFEFDFAAVAAHRRAHKDSFARDGAHLTYTAYIVAATVAALKAHPMVNSSWSDEGILLKREIHIGMATAIDDGLIVPVIKNADGLNLLGLARAINDLADRARAKQLKPDEVKGGTFSITNHGTTGSLFATPIINQPQCGILGVGAIEKRVKVIDDAIAIRPLAYVSFTFDHRILDGASADRFVSTIKEQIEGWR